MDVAHRWHPIRDCQVDPAALVQSELTPLTALWREPAASIEDRFRRWIEGCIVAGLRRRRIADL